MSIIKSEDSSKWINALVTIAAVLAGFVVTKFFYQIGAWFDLEAKISNFNVISQGLGVISGALVFIIVLKNSKTSGYLHISVPVAGDLIMRIQVDPCPAAVKRRDNIIVKDIVLEDVNP